MATNKSERISKVFNNWLSQVSENSRASYGRVVPQFFELTLGVEVEDLTEFALESLTPTDVYERYIETLKKEGYKNATIANYLSVVRSFINELESNRVFMDMSYIYLRNNVLSTKKLKDDSENRAKMSVSEYDEFHDWLLERDWSTRYADRGVKYALALKFMFTTAIRVHATFNNIRWNNIKLEEDSIGNEVYVIYALDKGDKVNKKPVSNEFYEELYNGLYTGEEDGLIFEGLSKQTFTRLMSQFSKESGREITPHSIKVGAGTKLYNMTKDIRKVQKFLDHTDIKTTMRYIRDGGDMTDTGSFVLSTKINIDNLEKMTYNQIMTIIKDRPDLAYTIMQEAQRRGFTSV